MQAGAVITVGQLALTGFVQTFHEPYEILDAHGDGDGRTSSLSINPWCSPCFDYRLIPNVSCHVKTFQ